MSKSVSDRPEQTASHTQIHVLLVDDNERWAEFTKRQLESAEHIRVTLALSANEALVSLRETTSIDCVVADYKMPEITGLQLLERVRDEDPTLPFIIVTGSGSEAVASQAINAGVSDYFQKDPRSDQTQLLRTRIEQAVKQYRLHRRITESESRYRTITEQISDAIVTVQEDRIRFSNQRFGELVGRPNDDLTGSTFVDEWIHPSDQTAVRKALATAGADEDDNRLRDMRIRSSDGRVRDCEYTIEPIPFDNDIALLVSIRDVTSRKQRERTLERERDLNRTVQRSLLSSRTQDGLEADIVSALISNGYALAWIGETVDASVRSRAVDGDEMYVDSLTGSLDSRERSGEPSLWCLRSREPQFVDDVSEMFETEWRDRALDAGFQSAAALPLEHDGVGHGVLAVYHDRPGRIDENERELLSELADTISFAISHLESRRALQSNHIIDIELVVHDPSYYLFEALTSADVDVSSVDITVTASHRYGDDSYVQYLTVSGLDATAVSDSMASHAAVESITKTHADTQDRFQVVTTNEPPELMLSSLGAVVDPTTITADGVTLRLLLSSRSNVGDVVDRLEESYGTTTVQSCVESEKTNEISGTLVSPEGAGLTEKQAASLSAAYHHGYFEQPREHSATEISDSLDIAHSTFLQHLRVAQKKLLGQYYELSG